MRTTYKNVPDFTPAQAVKHAEKFAARNGGKVTVAFACRIEQMRARVYVDATGVRFESWPFGDLAAKRTVRVASLAEGVARAMDMSLAYVSAY